jgi:hypothetical protein
MRQKARQKSVRSKGQHDLRSGLFIFSGWLIAISLIESEKTIYNREYIPVCLLQISSPDAKHSSLLFDTSLLAGITRSESQRIAFSSR